MRIFSCLNLSRVTSLFPSQIYISWQKNVASFPHEIFSFLLSFKLLFFFLVATIVLRHQTLEIHYQIQFFFLPITYRYLPVSLSLSISLSYLLRSLAEKSAKRADYKIYADDGTGFGSVWEPVRKNGLARALAINQGSALNPARWRVGVGGGGGRGGTYTGSVLGPET